MLKKVFIIIILFVVGMIGGIFSDQIFWPYFVERPLFYQYDLGKGPVHLTEVKEIYIQENVALVEQIEKVGKTVVAVESQTARGIILRGSGLIVTSDGLMVTLAELIPHGSDFDFFIEGESVSFQVLKRDLEKNLALIKIPDSFLVTIGFARMEELELGQRVFLVGDVFKDGTSSKMVNEGIVKSFDQNSIQTSIVEGNPLAGSPLFNIEGEVLGINTIDAKGNVIAIPISEIREFIGL